MRSSIGGGPNHSVVRSRQVLSTINNWWWGDGAGGGGGGDTALLMVGGEPDILNRYVSVNFDPDVYGAGGGALLASQLQITNFNANGGTALTVSISTITKPDGNPLVGGEQQVQVNITISGGNPTGVETFQIQPSAAGAYEDGDGNGVSASDTTGDVTLYLELDAMYKAGVLFALNNSITPPPLNQRLIDNAWFVYERAQGFINEKDFWHLITYTNAWATIDFITATARGIFTGTVTITQYLGGIASASSYFSTGYDPLNNGVKWLQDDASMWIGIGNNVQNAAVMMGMRGAASANLGHTRVQGRNTSDQSGGCVNINSGGNSTVATVTNCIGLQGVSRESSVLTKHYLNGTELTSAVTASNTRSSRKITVWSENADGVQSASNQTMRANTVFGGAGMQDKIAEMNTGFQTWIAATNAEIPSAIADRFYQGGGQSELNGGGILWSSLTAPQLATYDIGLYNTANIGANCYVKSEVDTPWAILESRVNGITGAGATNQFGEIYVIALAEAQKHPGEDLYFLWRPIDGTFIVNPSGANSWLEGGLASSAWERYLDVYQAGIAALVSVTLFQPVIYWQGTAETSDQDDGTLANNYGTRQALVLDQFADNTGATTFVVPKVHSGLPPAGYPYMSIVEGHQEANALTYPYTLIDMDDLLLNVQHPSPASQIIIAGLRLSDEML